jgi:adenylate cyclase
MLPEVLGIRKNVPVIHVRMGIATGDVTIGSIGSEDVRSYTVIGDNVNLASRLEGANKYYGTQILISEETRRLAGDLIEVREIDAIRLAGKAESARIYELLGRKDKGDTATKFNALRDPYERGLQSFRAGQLDQADLAFDECLKVCPTDGPALLFKQRVVLRRAQSPDQPWDNVWTMSEK